MTNLETSNKADSQWNERIKLSPLGGYQQTTYHADFMIKYQNQKPLFLYFKNNDEIIGQQLLFLRNRGTSNIKKIFGKMVKPYYFWKNSVLIFNDEYADEITELFTSFVKNKKYTGRDNPVADYHHSLPYVTIGTVLLEIKKTFEETISGRDPTSTQKHIAMAAHEDKPTKKGLTVKPISNTDEIKTYYDMLIEHRKYLNIQTIYDYAPFEDRILTLTKHGHGGALLAYHENTPVSGITFFNYNGWLQNANVANTKYSLEKKLSSLDYLRCYLISIGVKTKGKFFDFGGIVLEPKNEKESKIGHSQRKWGGQIVRYNRYSNI